MSLVEDETGWIGTGSFGRAVCERLLDQGMGLRVYNRTRSKTSPLIQRGAALAQVPRELRNHAIVFLCLGSAEAVDCVLFDPETGLASSPLQGTVIVDTSTVGSVFARAAAERLAEMGATYVDCPLSGGVAGARQGDLTAILSGAGWAIRKVQPVVARFSRKQIAAGARGRAQDLKVLNNLAEALNLWSAAEVVAAGASAGLELHLMAEVFREARGRSAYMSVLLDCLASNDATSGVSLQIRTKDLTLARRLLEHTNVDAVLSREVIRAFEELQKARGASADQCVCYEHLARTRSTSLA